MENKRENLTREYILKSFEKLMETHNYDDISVCDIADKAGVSRMSFYRNFKSKEDLVLQFLEEIAIELKANVEHQDTINQFSVAKQCFEIFKTYSKVFSSLLCSPISKTLGTAITQRLSENVPHDYISKASKYIPTYYFGAITHVLIQWMRDGMKESTDDMARLICSLNAFTPPMK